MRLQKEVDLGLIFELTCNFTHGWRAK